MASKMPSMTALLGLLAIAGYQNRDKIAEMLKGAGAPGDKPSSGTQPGLGGVLGNLGGEGATGGVGGLLGGGLGELFDDSSRAVRERLLSRGSMTAPTRRLLHLNSNRRLGRMSWQPWRSKPAFRRTSFSPGFRANCRRPLTNTPRTADFPVRTLEFLNQGGTRDGHHLDDHHRVYRGRYRQVHHARTQ